MQSEAIKLFRKENHCKDLTQYLFHNTTWKTLTCWSRWPTNVRNTLREISQCHSLFSGHSPAL